MQYLIRTIEHNGETFTDVITVRDNERYQVVEAESKAQALEKVEKIIKCPNCGSWNTDHEYLYVENKPVMTIFKCYECGFKDDWKYMEGQ